MAYVLETTVSNVATSGGWDLIETTTTLNIKLCWIKKKLFAYEMRDSNPRSKLVYPALLSLEMRKNYLVVKSYAENPFANFEVPKF